jgi:ABC-type multidrug transport system ATPase subunit
MDNTKIRNTLAAFLFYGDDVFKQVSALSGGERGRLSLAKLMLGNANFLILDEPTNHLDITSKEILENALNEYEGTVLYVSHDRYFINRTATRILALEGGTFTGYPGNYDYYLEKRDVIGTAGSAEGAALSDGGTTGRASAVMPSGTNVSESKLSWQEQKAQEAEKRKFETMSISPTNMADGIIEGAILKAHSPSCGSGKIYDGTFTRTLTAGDGVFAALLKAHGIPVYTEEDGNHFGYEEEK